MKALTKVATYRTLATLFLIALVQAITFAQDSTSKQSSTTKSVTTESTTTTWYTEPWVWIVGGAVLLLLIVALVRSGSGDRTTASRTDKVTVTKSTETDV